MAKIAISLPEETLQAVEKERLAAGLNRSEFFRRAVEEHLRRVKEREDVEQYIQGYLKYPETMTIGKKIGKKHLRNEARRDMVG